MRRMRLYLAHMKPIHHRQLARAFSVLSWLAISTLSSTAQVQFGVLAGPTFSNMKFYDGIEETTEHKLGVDAGCMLEIPLHRKFSLAPELAYRQKGYVEVPPEMYAFKDYRYLVRFDYLDLSLLLRFYPRHTFSGFHLVVGPSLGWLMGGRVRDANAEPFDPRYILQGQDAPVTAFDPKWLGYNTLEFAVTAGFGVSIPAGRSRIMVEYRYQYGFTNVHNNFALVDVNGGIAGHYNSNNRGMMLNLGWLLPVGDGGGTVVEPAQ